MEALIDGLGLPPLVALTALLVAISFYIARKLTQIDGRISYLLKTAERSEAEDRQIWEQVTHINEELAGIRDRLGRIEGKFEGGK